MSIALLNLRKDFLELVAPIFGSDLETDYQIFLEHIKRDNVKGVYDFFGEYCKNMGKITGEEPAQEYKNCLISIFASKVNLLNNN